MDNRNEVIMFKVGDLIIDYCGDIGVVVYSSERDWWTVHYINGTGKGNLYSAEMRLLCSK